ncbi:hypothetical protein D9615_001572 [Tricholomella constricta]|uniref:triacylglycerol lipase n=1 Tax=Tricholomella constricta TaxID=117010 RepID=A0A8H5HPC6_9AGAR|nr:hypothetical protein D9615_001572 [Tricholomella constricta]
MARTRLSSPDRRPRSSRASSKPWKSTPLGPIRPHPSNASGGRARPPWNSCATPSPLRRNPRTSRLLLGFDPNDDTIYGSEPDYNEDQGDSDDEDSFFHWEEESTLFSHLLDTPGQGSIDKHDTLVESLQPAFHHRSRELKKEIAETFVPTVNRVKRLHKKIETDVDRTFEKGISIFDQTCKDMEALAIKDHDELERAWGTAQRNIGNLFVELREAYKAREQLWADFEKAMDEIADPAIERLKALPAKVERTIATLEKHAKSLEKDETSAARLRSLHERESEIVEWDQVEVLGPDVEDRHTLAQLARMAGNAYALPGRKNWYEVDQAWNSSFPFGWEDSDGFRGHVFLSSDNSTVVLSIKGTTLNGPTSKKDKFNDNLVDISWTFRTVCNCYAHNWRCDDPCLTNALIQDSLFYSIGVNLINDLRHIYPAANLWLVGHSLGGALASLLGSTYGLPAVAFESPGERLAASRLHLPLPRLPNNPTNPPVAVTHVYHSGDPIPQGACTGFGSPCAQAGFALETRCHLGKSIVFDTVQKLGWKVDVRRHIIRQVITKVLEIEDVEWEEGREVPLARVEEHCVDCFKWEFGNFKDEDGARPLYTSE